VFLAAAALLTVLCFALTRGFLFRIVSPDLAAVNGLGRGYDLMLLLIFAIIVALGIKLVGTLLMGALTIIPASIARNVSRSMRRYQVVSAVLGGAISVAGVWIAGRFGFLPGPSIVLLGACLFVLSMPLARRIRAQ
jgi:zinc transport system permease protein